MKRYLYIVAAVLLMAVASKHAQAQYAYPYQFNYYSSAPIGGYGPNLPYNLYPPRSPVRVYIIDGYRGGDYYYGRTFYPRYRRW